MEDPVRAARWSLARRDSLGSSGSISSDGSSSSTGPWTQPIQRLSPTRKPKRRSGLPQIASPDGQARTLGMQGGSRSAVAHVRSLARQSVEKNREVLALAREVNTGLQAATKRMKRRGHIATQQNRVQRMFAAVDDMRCKLSDLRMARLEREERVGECASQVFALGSSIWSPTAANQERHQQALVTLSARSENAQEEYRQLHGYGHTLRLLAQRAAQLKAGAQARVERMQKSLRATNGELSTMRQDLHLLQEALDDTIGARDAYRDGLVADRAAHFDQIKRRQQVFRNERQIDKEQEEQRKTRRQQEERSRRNRERHSRKQESITKLKQVGLGQSLKSTKDTVELYATAARRLETETGVRDAEELVARFLRLHHEKRSSAACIHHKQQQLAASKSQYAAAQQELSTVRLQPYTVRGSTSVAHSDELYLRVRESTQYCNDQHRRCTQQNRLIVEIREALLWLLLRVSAHLGYDQQDAAWAERQWARGADAAVGELIAVMDGLMRPCADTASSNGRETPNSKLDAKIWEARNFPPTDVEKQGVVKTWTEAAIWGEAQQQEWQDVSAATFVSTERFSGPSMNC